MEAKKAVPGGFAEVSRLSHLGTHTRTCIRSRDAPQSRTSFESWRKKRWGKRTFRDNTLYVHNLSEEGR